MPKLLVVFHGGDGAMQAVARAFVEGARAVRFTEVRTVVVSRGVDGATSWGELGEYDGLAIGLSGDEQTDESLTRSLTAKYPANTLENVVGATLSRGEGSSDLRALSRLGMILVPAPRGSLEPEERARRHGARLATVAGWVRHALNHEHAHHHDHQHSH